MIETVKSWVFIGTLIVLAIAGGYLLFAVLKALGIIGREMWEACGTLGRGLFALIRAIGRGLLAPFRVVGQSRWRKPILIVLAIFAGLAVFPWLFGAYADYFYRITGFSLIRLH